MSDSQQRLDALEGLGFTGLEATTYVHLLRTSPATGYRVAKEMGRTFSTTYRVLESLEHKGAVVLDDGESKLYRAIPTADLVRQLKTKVEGHGKQLVEASRQIPTSALDDRIYQLKTPDQIFEPGEIWEFVIQEYSNILGNSPAALGSVGPAPFGAIAQASQLDSISSGSIITPEPATICLLALGGLLLRRRKSA